MSTLYTFTSHTLCSYCKQEFYLCKCELYSPATWDQSETTEDEHYSPQPTTLEIVLEQDHIHRWFQLSYSNYLVLPRSVLQSAPADLQKRLVDVLVELETLFGPSDVSGYRVHALDECGRYTQDPLADYERGRRVVSMRENSLGEVK